MKNDAAVIQKMILSVPYGACVECRINGNSMEPTLKNGQRIHIARVHAGSLCPGDVIAFVLPGRKRIIIHRIIKHVVGQNELEIVTKGDANNQDDPWIVNRSMILGKATAVFVNGSWASINALHDSFVKALFNKFRHVMMRYFFRHAVRTCQFFYKA